MLKAKRKSMYFNKVLVLAAFLIIAVSYSTEAQEENSKLHKGDLSCKRVISEFIIMDQELLGFTKSSDVLTQFAKKYKYKAPKTRLKRSLFMEDLVAFLVNFAGPYVRNFAVRVNRIIFLMPACQRWLRNYLKF